MRLAQGLLALSLVAAPAVLSAQSPSASPWKPLDDQGSRYQALSKDLLAMEDTRSADAETAGELYTISGSAFDYFTASSDLLYLYDNITEPANRASVRAMVRLRLQYYARLLDSNTEYVNKRLTHIQAPGVAQTVLRLRDELRRGSDLLKATVVK